MMRAAGAVRECLDQLDTATVGKAIEVLASSSASISMGKVGARRP